MPVLAVEGLSRSFGGVAAVNRVSFTLETGHIYGLIGPNGSGKTTLFNCITGLERLDAGRVQFKGERIDGLRPSRVARMGIGRTFQVIRVFPELTALENLLVVTRGARAEAERRGREMLEFVKLERLAGEYAGNLSYGQQKLVEFVRVLMTDPALILLDEPAAGMTHDEVARTAELVREINRTHALIVVEHDMQFVRMIAHTVTVMHQGAVLVEDTMDQILKNSAVRDIYLGKHGEA
jgi:urea transport system ATP-binding protein